MVADNLSWGSAGRIYWHLMMWSRAQYTLAVLYVPNQGHSKVPSCDMDGHFTILLCEGRKSVCAYSSSAIGVHYGLGAWQQVTGMETEAGSCKMTSSSPRRPETKAELHQHPLRRILPKILSGSFWSYKRLSAWRMSPNFHLNILELTIVLIEFELFFGNFMFRSLLFLACFVTSMFI